MQPGIAKKFAKCNGKAKALSLAGAADLGYDKSFGAPLPSATLEDYMNDTTRLQFMSSRRLRYVIYECFKRIKELEAQLEAHKNFPITVEK